MFALPAGLKKGVFNKLRFNLLIYDRLTTCFCRFINEMIYPLDGRNTKKPKTKTADFFC